MVSRQRRWQLKKQGEGKCAQCGKKRKDDKAFCDKCKKKHSVSMKLYRQKQKVEKPTEKIGQR